MIASLLVILLIIGLTQCPVRLWAALGRAKWLMRDYRATIAPTRTHYGWRCVIISRRGVGTIHWDGWRMTVSPGTYTWGRRPPPRWW